MKKRRIEEWMTEYAYLVTLCCVIAIVAGCAIYTRRLNVPAAAPAPELSAPAAQSASPAPTLAVTPLPTIAPLMAVSFGARTQWPVEGEALRVFDVQQPVFWEALGCWRVHKGLDIAAQAGSEVVSCADAQVTHTACDALWGWQVTMQQDERLVRYAGLESCCVKPGMRIRRGQTIGTLAAAIPCEGEMPAHLHLEVERDGVMQDPEAMLP